MSGNGPPSLEDDINRIMQKDHQSQHVLEVSMYICKYQFYLQTHIFSLDAGY